MSILCTLPELEEFLNSSVKSTRLVAANHNYIDIWLLKQITVNRGTLQKVEEFRIKSKGLIANRSRPSEELMTFCVRAHACHAQN